jgi:hypothetical protein
MRRGIVDYKFSCITGSVFGSAKRKVIYTTGAGARLVNETACRYASPSATPVSRTVGYQFSYHRLANENQS